MRSCVYSVFIGSYVFYLQLYLIFLEDILLDGIGNVETALALNVSSRGTLAKGDAINNTARLRVDKFQLDVLLFASYYLAGAIVVYTIGAEDRLLVAGTKGGKALQIVVKMLGDVLEVEDGIYIEDCLCLFGRDMFFYIFLESVSELLDMFPLHGETCSIGVSTKIDQQVAATLDG